VLAPLAVFKKQKIKNTGKQKTQANKNTGANKNISTNKKTWAEYKTKRHGRNIKQKHKQNTGGI
jgi:hypothetical protein